MESKNHSLRVALVWNGTIYQEKVFSQTSEPIITMGNGDENLFSLPATGFPDSLQVFERQEKGYKLKFTDKVELSLTINDEEYDLEELVDERRAIKVGTVDTEDGKATVYEMSLHFGDWGVIDLGKINIFFQLMEKSDVVAGRGPKEMLDGPLTVALIIALVLHLGFLIAAFLQPPQPHFEDVEYHDRFADFAVDDIEDALEEEDDEEEEDTTAEKAGGEEGEFGDPEEEIEESETPELDEEMVDEIDVEDLGIHDALTDDVIGEGPLDQLFDSDGFEAEIAVAMAGDGDALEIGRGQGGMGLRGAGGGGGGEGYGRVGGLGEVDTGGGTGAGGEIGSGEQREVSPQVDTGTPSVGDFCDPADIRRVVNARTNAIQHCYERQLQTNPELAGSLTANWRIELDGSVSNVMMVESTVNNAQVEGCITRVIERMRFEEPDGGMCDINYPFVFSGLQ